MGGAAVAQQSGAELLPSRVVAGFAGTASLGTESRSEIFPRGCVPSDVDASPPGL